MLDRADKGLAPTTLAMALIAVAVSVAAAPTQAAPDPGGETEPAPAASRAIGKSRTRISGWDSHSRVITPDTPLRVSLRVRSGRSAKPAKARTVSIQANTLGDPHRFRTVTRRTALPSGKLTFLIRPDREPFAHLEGTQVGYRVVVPATKRARAARTGVRWVTALPNGVSGPIQPISSNQQGEPGNGPSDHPAVSPDGTKVAFTSTATNLTHQPVGGQQIYVKDLRTGAVTLVSGTATGVAGNANSDGAAWSPDSREIAFASTATNLGPARGTGDLWIKNVMDGSLRLLASTGMDWTLPTPPHFRGMNSPVLWSPDGTVILAHVDSKAANDFECTPSEPTELPSAGDCAYGLGAIEVATGIITMIADGRYVMYGDGPRVPETLPRAWSPDGAHISVDVRLPCMHCEGPNLKILDSAGTVTTSLVSCVSYMDACDAQLSGWRATSELIYNEYYEGWPGGFLSGMRIWNAQTGATRTVPTPLLPPDAGELGDFSPDGAHLAVAGWNGSALRTVQSVDVSNGRMATWIAGPHGKVPQPRPGGFREADWGPEASDPHWVGNRSMVFVTANALVPADRNGVNDIVMKTLR